MMGIELVEMGPFSHVRELRARATKTLYSVDYMRMRRT